MDSTSILNIALAIGVGLALFFTVMFLLTGLIIANTPDDNPVRLRLQAMKESSGSSMRSSRAKLQQSRSLKESFLTFTEPIAQNLYGKNEAYLKSIKVLLTEAGLPDNDASVRRILSVRVAVGLFIGGILFLVGLMIMLPILYSVILMIVGMLFGATFVMVRLKGMAKRRKDEIRYTLSDTLDLMVVCMEAGLGLDATINRIADEISRMAPDLAVEFRRLTKELNAGIPRGEAFHNLGSRAGVEEMKALCALVIQTDKLGTSIADTLRIYAEDVRSKRKQKAELLASQASIKLTFPLVILIFPPMFIVLLGPAVIQMIEVFSGPNGLGP